MKFKTVSDTVVRNNSFDELDPCPIKFQICDLDLYISGKMKCWVALKLLNWAQRTLNLIVTKFLEKLYFLA